MATKDNETIKRIPFSFPSKEMPNVLATLMQQKLGTNPLLINMKNNKLLKDMENFLYKDNLWKYNFKKCLYHMSKYGYGIFILTKINKNWQLILVNNIINWEFDAVGNILKLTTLAQVIKGSYGYFQIYETRTKEQITRNIKFAKNNDKDISPTQNDYKDSTIDFFEEITGYTLDLIIKTKSMTAFIFRNLFNGGINEIPFGLPDGYTTKSDLAALDSAYESYIYWLEWAIPRVFLITAAGSNINGEAIFNGGTAKEPILSVDGKVNLKIATINDDFNLTSGGTSPIAPFTPDPNGVNIAQNAYNQQWLTYLEKNGHLTGTLVGKNQKSTDEINRIDKNEFTLLADKIDNIQLVLKDLFYSVALNVFGINLSDDDSFVIKLKKSDPLENKELTDNIIKQLNANLITNIKAIAEINNVSEVQAKQIIKQIEKENENNNVSRETIEPNKDLLSTNEEKKEEVKVEVKEEKSNGNS